MSRSPHFEPHSGYADPVRDDVIARGCAKLHGAESLSNTAVARIIHSGEPSNWSVYGVGRVHEADAVCVVAGPWTDALLSPLGVKIGIKSERAQIAFFKRPPQNRALHLMITKSRQLLSPHGGEV